MIIRLWPWLALLLIALGILIFYYFGQTIQIHCYRLNGPSVACSSRIYWLDLFSVSEPQTFAPVSYASSEENCSPRPGESDVCSFSVILHNEKNQFVLDGRFFNLSTAEKTASAINTFIAADTIFMDAYPSDKITITLTSCVGVPFVLLGALMLWVHFGGNAGPISFN